MELSDGRLLRIFLAEDDSYGEEPLYEAILRLAQDMKMAGATVLRGFRGYGPSSRQVKHFLRTTEARPLVVEIIDSEEKIDRFLPMVEEVLDGGAMTIEKVTFCAHEPKR